MSTPIPSSAVSVSTVPVRRHQSGQTTKIRVTERAHVIFDGPTELVIHTKERGATTRPATAGHTREMDVGEWAREHASLQAYVRDEAGAKRGLTPWWLSSIDRFEADSGAA